MDSDDIQLRPDPQTQKKGTRALNDKPRNCGTYPITPTRADATALLHCTIQIVAEHHRQFNGRSKQKGSCRTLGKYW